MYVVILIIIIVYLVYKQKTWIYENMSHCVKHSSSKVVSTCKSTPKTLPPGDMGLPFIGEMIQFLRHTDPGTFFDQKTSKYGNIYKTHLFFKPTIRICDIDYVKQVLLNEHTLVRGTWPPSFRSLMGNGALSICSPENHRLKKRLLLESFQKQNLTTLFPLIQETVISALKSWSQHSHTDVYDSIKLLAFTSTCQVLLGINPSEGDIRGMCKEFEQFIGGIFTVPINIPGLPFNKAMKARASIRELLSKYLKSTSSDKEQHGVLTSFLQKSKGKGSLVSPEEVLDIAVELLFGGQETSTAVLTQFIVLMKQYPYVLETLEEEIATIKANSEDPPPSWSQISSLQYSKAVMKEILRLFPPIGGGFRKVIQTFELGGYTIPKGWVITYAIPETHKNNRLVTDINTFNPNRWMSPSSSEQAGRCYIPFGAGARGCVGKEYAIMLAQTFIVYSIKYTTWDIISGKDVRFLSFPVRHPEAPILCQFTEKEEWL